MTEIIKHHLADTASHSATLLIADDESFIRQAYSDGFKRAGYTVVTAENGTEAIDALHANADIDVVLLDLVMPRINGFEVLKEITNMDRKRPLKVIVLSNLSQQTDEDEALALGAAKFIVKSDYSLQELRTVVADVLSGKA